VIKLAEQMQDYYDGALETVQKELEAMSKDEADAYRARAAMFAVDSYHQAIKDSIARRRELTQDEEQSFMAAEDVLAQQARIVERAFEGMRRLEDLEASIEEEFLEEERDPEVPGLDEEVVDIVDKLVKDRLNTIDEGGETPEQKLSKEKQAEERRWREVEEFIMERQAARDDEPPAGMSDEAEIEAEALQSQQELDALFKQMNSDFDNIGNMDAQPRYKEKYDYKYKYNMFEVSGS